MNKNYLIILLSAFKSWPFYFCNSQKLNIILLIVIIIHFTNNLNVMIKLLQTNELLLSTQ